MSIATRQEFKYEVSDRGLAHNLPQRMGRRLWAPMVAMALLAWTIGLILSWIRAGEIASANPDPDTIATLGQLVPAFMFIGFLAVFAAVSFAIARILGALRKGGGEVQEAAGRSVHTLRMPATAGVFLAVMMTAMMTIAVTVVLHFVAAAGVGSWSQASLEQWTIVLEGVRRTGVALYLFAITFGLGTILTVLQFQSDRVRRLPTEPIRT